MIASDRSGDRVTWIFERRMFLRILGATLAGLVLSIYEEGKFTCVEAAPLERPKRVIIVEFTDAGERERVISVPVIRKTDAVWKAQLSASAFEITRRSGTEIPGTGELLSVHNKGMFRCICCDTALFSSDTKYESGTGWPSFWAPIAKENVVEEIDVSDGMTRTAVSCRRCEAHLGHVFDDGPAPTGLRYCLNSVALRFANAA